MTVPAYAILKANADASPDLHRSAAPALTFYAKISKRKAAKTPPEPAAKT